MLKLNHLNLPTSDVPALSRFFTEAFAFRQVGVFGNGNLASLANDDGFEMILMHDKHLEAGDHYPTTFHAGFLVPTRDEVHQRHTAILAAGFEAPEPAVLKRGGPPAYGFYCVPPGGVMIEVSTAE